MAQNQTLRYQTAIPTAPVSGAITLFADVSGNLKTINSGSSVGVLHYNNKRTFKCVLTITGAIAPKLTILENTLGYVPYTQYVSVGRYGLRGIVEDESKLIFNTPCLSTAPGITGSQIFTTSKFTDNDFLITHTETGGFVDVDPDGVGILYYPISLEVYP